MMTVNMMMQLVKMPIPNDDDVYDHNCGVADVVEHDADGIGEDDDNGDNHAEGNDDGSDHHDDDVDKLLGSS